MHVLWNLISAHYDSDMKTSTCLTFLFILSLCAPLSAHADDDSAMSANIGLRGALGWSAWFRGEGTPGLATPEYRQGFYMGISSGLNVHDFNWGRAGIQLEALFSRRGTIIRTDGGSGSNIRMDYLELPLLLRALFRISDPVSLYTVAGPRIGFLLDAQRKDINGNIQKLSGFDRVDAGISAGIGAVVEISPRFLISLEGRYDQGFTNIDDGLGENPGIRHRTFFLTAGLDIELWRQDTSNHNRTMSP